MIKDINFPIFGDGELYQIIGAGELFQAEFNMIFSSVAFGTDIPVQVELTVNDVLVHIVAPTKEQTEQFKWFKGEQHEIKKSIISVMFQEYCSQLDEIRACWDDLADKHAPVLANKNDIWKLLSFFSINIDDNFLSINFRTSWDEEHQRSFLFQEKKIFDIE